MKRSNPDFKKSVQIPRVYCICTLYMGTICMLNFTGNRNGIVGTVNINCWTGATTMAVPAMRKKIREKEEKN